MCLPFRYLGEQCDDMNFANGDGCSNQCKKEPLFNCVGTWPSSVGRNVKGIVHKLCLYVIPTHICIFFLGKTKGKFVKILAQLFSIQWRSQTFKFQSVSHTKLLYGFRTHTQEYSAVAFWCFKFFFFSFGNFKDMLKQFYNCHFMEKSCITILQNTCFCVKNK